jgi:hypothetical protein
VGLNPAGHRLSRDLSSKVVRDVAPAKFQCNVAIAKSSLHGSIAGSDAAIRPDRARWTYSITDSHYNFANSITDGILSKFQDIFPLFVHQDDQRKTFGTLTTLGRVSHAARDLV